MSQPREYTEAEVRQLFTDHVNHMIQYWANARDNEHRTPREDSLWRLEGLTHSIFATLDGNTSLPAFIVAPMPHDTDRAFHEEQGENWFPEQDLKTIRCDIAGTLRYWRIAQDE